MTRAYAAARRRPLPIAIAALVALAFIAGPQVGASTPANKVAVAGSTFERGEAGKEIPLLAATMRNPASKGLVIQVTLECSILTQLRTVGDDVSRARATLDVWVEINDERVVTISDGDDNGEVTFCDREYQRETIDWADEDAVIEDFIRTKQAHGFNWIDLNPGNGVKEIVVYGRLDVNTTFTPEGGEPFPTSGVAEVVVGNRTLVVEPVDVARNETKGPGVDEP